MDDKTGYKVIDRGMIELVIPEPTKKMKINKFRSKLFMFFIELMWWTLITLGLSAMHLACNL